MKTGKKKDKVLVKTEKGTVHTLLVVNKSAYSASSGETGVDAGSGSN